MSDKNYLCLDSTPLNRGIPTKDLIDTLSRNIFYCYNVSSNKESLLSFYSDTYYGVFKEQGVVRQLSSNLINSDYTIKLVSFNDIFKDMIDYEEKSHSSISIEETAHILSTYLNANLKDFLKTYQNVNKELTN